MSSLLVSIRSVFYPVDLQPYPARSVSYQLPSVTTFNTPEEDWTPEDRLPSVPPELVHMDLDELLLDHELWNQLEAAPRPTTTSRLVMLTIGQVPRSTCVPVKLPRRTCFDCSRPLWLYKLASCDPDDREGPGWCPGCLLTLRWRQAWRKDTGQSLRDGLKPQREDDFIQRQLHAYLRQWNLEDQRWWENQQAEGTTLYSAWRDRQLARLSSLPSSSAGTPPA